ncbi:hypothetical protein EMCRGX_G028790 [Ephydatia muelleri]
MYTTATRSIPKRRRPLYATATTQILNLSNLHAKRQRYQKDLEENRAAKRQRYQEDVEENRAAKRQRYQEDVDENRAAKRQKYEDNSAAIKASERNRYWNDPAVRLAKRAAERKRYRRGHRTTTTTQSLSDAQCKAINDSYNQHLSKANDQILGHLKSRVQLSPFTSHAHLDIPMQYSFDYCQQVSLPYSSQQRGTFYFSTACKVQFLKCAVSHCVIRCSS